MLKVLVLVLLDVVADKRYFREFTETNRGSFGVLGVMLHDTPLYPLPHETSDGLPLGCDTFTAEHIDAYTFVALATMKARTEVHGSGA